MHSQQLHSASFPQRRQQAALYTVNNCTAPHSLRGGSRQHSTQSTTAQRLIPSEAAAGSTLHSQQLHSASFPQRRQQAALYTVNNCTAPHSLRGGSRQYYAQSTTAQRLIPSEAAAGSTLHSQQLHSASFPQRRQQAALYTVNNCAAPHFPKATTIIMICT